MLKVISLALLFLIRLRFPFDKSITHVLRSKYGNLVVKELPKFEKIDYSLQKCNLHLTLLMACLHDNIVPKILNFRVSSSYLKSSRAYHACQIKLVKEEISIKKSRIRRLEKDFNNRKEKLRETLGIIDYTHVICLFLTQNDRKLAHHQNIHSKKLFNLGLEVSKVSHDSEKIIFNYSSHMFSKSEKSSLCKGLNFAIPPDKLEYSDYLLPFELLYRDIKDLDLSNEKTNFLKAKIKDCALSSFKLYNEKGAVSCLNKGEISALKTLSKNNYLFMQKSDKGNSIVLINKSDYLDKMYNILSDSKNLFSKNL